MRVVVVGSGPAGLSAAHSLMKVGILPVVLEQNDRTGGRMLSQHREGYVIDVGTQFLSSRYTSTIALCRDLGLGGQFHRFRLTTGVFRDGKIYPGFGVIGWLNRLRMARLVVWLIHHRRRLSIMFPQEAMKPSEPTAAEFALSRFDQEFLDYWFEPFVSGATSAAPEQVAASAILTYMRLNLYSMIALRPGMGLLARRLHDVLPEMRLNTSARRIVIERNRVHGVEVLSNGEPETLDADAVIIATPAPAAARLLPDFMTTLRAFLESVPYTACIHIIYALERKALEKLYGIAVPRKAGLRLSILSEDTNKCPAYAPTGAGILHAITSDAGARALWALSDEAIQTAITSEIHAILPHFEQKPVFNIVHRWPRSMCLLRPGYMRALAAFGDQSRHIEGLAFAGDYLTLPCLEGAVLSGQRAAEQLANSSVSAELCSF